MNSFESAYRWLLFQVGLATRTQDVLLMAEASLWEARFNQVWHHSSPETLLDAFTTLSQQNLISDRGGEIFLTQQGTVCWEQSFSPAWSKAYCNYEIDPGITTIESASIETCVRVFYKKCFLEFVKLESVAVSQLDGFDVLYWKRISPAFRLQFEVDKSPTSVRYPTLFLSTEYASRIQSPEVRPLINTCRELESKILAWYSSAAMSLEWYDFPEDEYVEKTP